MTINDAFPNSLVDLDALSDPIGVGEFIPLRDGRTVEIFNIRVQGVALGLPSESTSTILVHVRWFDADTPSLHLQAEMPLNMLFDIYVQGQLELLSTVQITPVES